MPSQLQVAFVEQPETVDFLVTVMGGSTLSGLIPSLKAWLVGFARDSLISMYVMPDHWTYRLDPVSQSLMLMMPMWIHLAVKRLILLSLLSMYALPEQWTYRLDPVSLSSTI